MAIEFLKERVSNYAKMVFGDQITELAKKAGIEPFTTFPNSTVSRRVEKGLDNRYITGLTKEEEKYYGEFINKDLSPTSDFWAKFSIILRTSNGLATFNSDNVYDIIAKKAALANNYIAPSLEDLERDVKYKDINFYLFNEKESQNQTTQKSLLLDEITAIIFNMRTNRDKMMVIAHALNLTFSEKTETNVLYNILTNHKESIKAKSIVAVEDFLNLLKSNIKNLQANFYVSKCIGKFIFYESDQKVYIFKSNLEEKSLITGINKSDTINFFLEPENEKYLKELMDNYKISVSKK